MFILFCILLVANCLGFAYLFYKILEITKDVETLYDDYSEQLQKIVYNNLNRKEVFNK